MLNVYLAPFEVEDVELGSFDGESDNFYEKTQKLHSDSDVDEGQEQDFIVDDGDSMQQILIILSSC